MNATVSSLPAAARAKLETLQAAAADTPPVPAADTPPVPAVDTPPAAPAVNTPPAAPAVDTPPAAPAGERVTLSREEVNELRAAAGAAQTALNRLEESESRCEALMQRLTELEASHKGNPSPAAPAAPAAPRTPTQWALAAAENVTADEEEQFGESRAYIEKVAMAKVAELLNPILGEINGSYSALQASSAEIQTTVKDTQQNAFSTALSKAAPRYKEAIRHKHWPQFLDEVEEYSGYTMEQLLAAHLHAKDAEKAAKIYARFISKYMPDTETPAGGEFAGADPGSGAAVLPTAPKVVEKLKLSARNKASKDYIAGRITYEKLQEVQKAFTEAEKAGNVDYDN